MLRIFGHSDDNVEIREAGQLRGQGVGLFAEEVGCYGTRVTIIVGGERTKVTLPDGRRGESRSHGVRVTGRHDGRVGWTFSVALLGDENGPELFPIKIEREGYTPVVVIDAPEGVRLRAKKKGLPWWDLRKGLPGGWSS